jgi:hypothetical protein
MSQDLELAQAGPVARQAEMAAPTEGAAFLNFLERAARDPGFSVDKVKELMEMRQRSIMWEAEREFKAAFARLQPQLPRIVKEGKITFNGASQPYARYEDIDKAIRPLLSEEGFSVSFTFESGDTATVCRCKLAHRAGHSETTSTPPLPWDKSGSKNNVQAVGSTMAYAKRYALCNALNIVTVGQDNDGHGAAYIDEEQVMKLNDLIQDCQFSPARIQKVLDWQKADKIEHIQESHYKAVKEFLEEKLRGKGGAR